MAITGLRDSCTEQRQPTISHPRNTFTEPGCAAVNGAHSFPSPLPAAATPRLTPRPHDQRTPCSHRPHSLPGLQRSGVPDTAHVGESVGPRACELRRRLRRRCREGARRRERRGPRRRLGCPRRPCAPDRPRYRAILGAPGDLRGGLDCGGGSHGRPRVRGEEVRTRGRGVGATTLLTRSSPHADHPGRSPRQRGSCCGQPPPVAAPARSGPARSPPGSSPKNAAHSTTPAPRRGRCGPTSRKNRETTSNGAARARARGGYALSLSRQVFKHHDCGARSLAGGSARLARCHLRYPFSLVHHWASMDSDGLRGSRRSAAPGGAALLSAEEGVERDPRFR